MLPGHTAELWAAKSLWVLIIYVPGREGKPMSKMKTTTVELFIT